MVIKTWWDSPEFHLGNVAFSLDADLCRWQVGVRWSVYDGEWNVTVTVLCLSLFIGRWL